MGENSSGVFLCQTCGEDGSLTFYLLKFMNTAKSPTNGNAGTPTYRWRNTTAGELRVTDLCSYNHIVSSRAGWDFISGKPRYDIVIDDREVMTLISGPFF